MKIYLFVATLLASAVVSAQDSTTCTCTSTLEWVINTFEDNDAGFSACVEERGEEVYRAFTKDLRERAWDETQPTRCYDLLTRYTAWFRSGHIGIEALSAPVRADDATAKGYLASTRLGLPVPPPTLKSLSERTLLLIVRSFELKQKPQLDSLLAANDSLLRATPNLVIDIRGATGLADASFAGLLPYLYTGPIRTPGTELLSTPVNNARFDTLMARPDFPKDMRPYLQGVKQALAAELGEFVNVAADPVTVLELDSVARYPASVGVLVDSTTASSAEEFVLAAKQSEKVKVFGVPTAGHLDIATPNSLVSPCKLYRLHYAVSRSLRLPERGIDAMGIRPDYLLPDPIPAAGWAPYAQATLENGQE